MMQTLPRATVGQASTVRRPGGICGAGRGLTGSTRADHLLAAVSYLPNDRVAHEHLRAHNPKVAGSNPAPATTNPPEMKASEAANRTWTPVKVIVIYSVAEEEKVKRILREPGLERAESI